MGAVSNLASVEEYLHTLYRSDCHYVDGVLVERNVGEFSHQETMLSVVVYFRERSKLWGIFAIHEWRVQVSPRRYRVPDVCVLLRPKPQEQILAAPPFICIEILSPDDRISRMQERIDDYLRFGVRYVWLIDPKTARAWVYTANSISEVRDGVLRTENPELTMPLAEVLHA